MSLTLALDSTLYLAMVTFTYCMGREQKHYPKFDDDDDDVREFEIIFNESQARCFWQDRNDAVVLSCTPSPFSPAAAVVRPKVLALTLANSSPLKVVRH